MAQSRKSCLYKNCKKEEGSTLFKFPTDRERFSVWCVNAGMNQKGEMDLREPRFLCEKHFSTSYICSQSRRKMLVYTAIPEKWKDNIDEDPKFTIVGESLKRGKRFRNNSYCDIKVESSEITSPPPRILNVRRRTFQRSPAELEEPIIDDEQTGEINIRSIDIANESHNETNTIYEEIVVPEPNARKYKFLVVKSKRKVDPTENITETISPHKKMKNDLEESNLIEEDSILDNIADKNEEESFQETITSSTPLESYNEFIFNGEMFVQMPKRVFEAEKEKIRKEADKCKMLLRKLKSHLNKMDLDS